MTRSILLTIIATASLMVPATIESKTRNVTDIKAEEISDPNIIYPESFETDTQRMLEGWYMKNYTATDDRYRRLPDVKTSDETIRERLGAMQTVIEMPFNSIVRSYIDRYTNQGREQVAALLGLSNYYMPIFEQALEENGLPLELKYLPVIESGLDPNAVSRHGATGLWQFMIATAKGLDMEVSSLVDERRDPYLSSQRAAKYLKDLYATYGDWSLAIAAYNCGPGAINKAMRRAGGEPSKHDFWSIYYYLTPETRGYVPMFIAANYVMNYHDKHNISAVLPTKPLVTDTLMISDRVHFNQISHVLDIPVEELRVLNPQFRADIIPGSPEHQYTLILPSLQCQAYLMSEEDIMAYEAEKYLRRLEVEPGDKPAEALAAEIAAEDDIVDNTPLESPVTTAKTTPAAKPVGKNATAQTGSKTVQHKVTPGQTLAEIGQMYGVTPEQIKEWNGLSRNTIRTGQMLRITTTSALASANGAKEVAPAQSNNYSPRQENKWTADNSSNTKQTNGQNAKKSNSSTKTKKAEPAAPKQHTVKSGENLSVIAKKYGTTVADLKKANGITGSGDELHPGQSLQLPGKGKGNVKSGSGSKSKSSSGSSKKSKKKKR